MKQEYVIRHVIQMRMGECLVWYACKLEYYDELDCDWILRPTSSQKRARAMKFSEEKAKKVVSILSNQEDEKGCLVQWEAVKVTP